MPFLRKRFKSSLLRISKTHGQSLPQQHFEENAQKIPLILRLLLILLIPLMLTLDYKCYTQARFLTCCSKITELTSSISVIVSFDVPGQDFASKYFLIFKYSFAKSSTVGMSLTGCDLENFPALHSFTNPKVILTPVIIFIIETSSYLVRYITRF